MPNCQECGAHVTASYARVFTPDGVERPRCCPNCPDVLRRKGKIREKRAKH